MYVQMGSSVIIYLCSRARNNQPLLIACKSIKIFQHIQIFMKKNSFFVHLRQKNNLSITHFSVCTALRMQRYNFFLIYEKFFLFLISLRSNDCYLFKCDRLKTAVIACNIGNGRLTALRQLIHIKRLTF